MKTIYQRIKDFVLPIAKAFWAPIGRVFENEYPRYSLCGLGFFALLVWAIGRIVAFVASPEAAKFRALGDRQNPPRPELIEPLRGNIYAHDNRPLAMTAEVYRLYFDFGSRQEALKLLRIPTDSLDSTKRIEQQALSKRLWADLDSAATLIVKSFDSKDYKITPTALKEMKQRFRNSFRQQSGYCPVVRLDIDYQQYKELMSQEPFLGQITDSVKGQRESRSLLRKIMTAPEIRGKRIRPFGSLAARTIGDIFGEKKDGLTVGSYGIEMSFDSLLRGTVGEGFRQSIAKDANNLRVIKPAVAGHNIYTTLDMNLQSRLERIMRNQLSMLKAESGTAILLDVPTGKILSISNLMYDTKKAGYVEGKNFAVSDISEPGSTFKVASMLVALDDGLVQASDTIDVGNGTWEVSGRTVRDHNAGSGGYGRITASQVIERSSNVGVAKIIYRHFKDNPGAYVQKVRDLAFGHDLRAEIPGSALAKVRMPNERWYGTTLSWMSYGYETQIPPIYTAAFFNAIANGGKLLKPYLVREIRDSDGRIIEQFSPKVVREQIAKPESIRAMQEMLRKVVTDGTGKKLNTPVVAISGKSGTAQIAENGTYKGAGGTSHQVSFCAYFPSETPRYTLMVVIRKPSKEFAAGGGSMAGPVVRELAEAIISMEKPNPIDSLGRADKTQRGDIAIGKKETLAQLLQQTKLRHEVQASIPGDAYIAIDATGKEQNLKAPKAGIVPALVGMSVEDANYQLMKAGYQVEIRGVGRITEQIPVAGTHLARGQKVVLILSRRS